MEKWAQEMELREWWVWCLEDVIFSESLFVPGENGRNGAVLPWTSEIKGHFPLISDVKKAEMGGFGPLRYSGQEKKVDLLKQKIWSVLSVLVPFMHEEGVI
jgi:hypothetical protein